jgi:hypothetical protein
MSIKLTDTQLVMLSAAAQRDDRCFEPPKNLKGGAAQRVATKLLAAGLAKEIKAKAGAVWRRDDETGQSYSLKLTAAGLKAIAVEDGGAPDDADGPTSPAVREDADLPAAAATPMTSPAATAPREGTKIAQVIGLLQRDHGATLDELIAATGWLPHTSRAALTGLRKRGYLIERQSLAGGGKSYVIAASAAA